MSYSSARQPIGDLQKSQNATVKVLVFADDHLTPASITGSSVAWRYAKAGSGAWGTMTPTSFTLEENGEYALVFNGATNLDTLGDIDIVGTATGIDNIVLHGRVVNEDSTAAIEDRVWNALLSNHSTAGSFGSRLGAILTGTASAGSSTTLTLTGGSSTTDFYKGTIVWIWSGTGAGQARQVKSYNGSTNVATMATAWATTPNNTSKFIVLPYLGDTIANLVWDEALTGATHNVSTSAGRRLRQLAAAAIWDGTAQGPGTGNNQIQLDVGASATNGIYDRDVIALTGGTGAGQSRVILHYVGSTNIATVENDWVTNPDSSTTFQILAGAPLGLVHEGKASAGGSATITFDAHASTVNDTYKLAEVSIVSGTGAGQTRRVDAYDGTTRIAIVNSPWITAPDSTSGYVVRGQDVKYVDTVSGDVLGNVHGYVNQVINGIGGDVGGNVLGQVGSVADQTLASWNPGTFGANTISLEFGSTVNDFYIGMVIAIYQDGGSPSAAGQVAFITAYDGATQTATISPPWRVVPTPFVTAKLYSTDFVAAAVSVAGAIWDTATAGHTSAGTFGAQLQTSTSAVDADVQLLINALAPLSATCQSGSTSTTVKLHSGASSVTDYYKGYLVVLKSGTGAIQCRTITAYDGTTKVATVDTAWKTTPDGTTIFALVSQAGTFVALTDADIDAIAAQVNASAIAAAVLDAARSGHVTLGSIGEGIALATGLLQGNFYMDNVDNTSPNGQTSARLRVFHTGSAAGAATPGGTGEGEFATFVVTTTYSGVGKISDHRVVQQ